MLKSFLQIAQETAAAIATRTANAAKVTIKSHNSYNNGVALTPPMGWSSWNTFRNKINEELILEIANAMAKSGLADAGYQYVNLDDCWQSSMRRKKSFRTGKWWRKPSSRRPCARPRRGNSRLPPPGIS